MEKYDIYFISLHVKKNTRNMKTNKGCLIWWQGKMRKIRKKWKEIMSVYTL